MKEKGFTLIELLVVVAIIGILAAIAIPQFAAYKTRSFNSRAESDLKNAVTSQEAYFVDHEYYYSCTDVACSATLPGLSELSGGVHMYFNAFQSGTAEQFAGATCHERGDKGWGFDSSATTSITSTDIAEGFCDSSSVSGLIPG